MSRPIRAFLLMLAVVWQTAALFTPWVSSHWAAELDHLAVHTQGKGLCGVYPHEVAETRVETVMERAREHGFPLRAAMEPE